ncbi:sporulation integral membrane protein YtvI [Thalassobacillus devorans]|uniref:Sporulation integral membrane protein YtvI n=1 Tax=Thalassobacillus devorans TaxID=279813 RepID=A0ABQ1PB08_9BACI|nr:sporulation integral membrane protein YtvI [Thalassobacillus devorans]NIK29883.1 sporulation integral membrane protein YtvI [Thalassobacillus devorans]GGC93609.1 sporulation integral membrane protein YtvI [Thalassobacillus devorans]
METFLINKIFRFFVVLLTLTGALILTYYAFQYAYPFFFAFLIALFINPAVNFLEERLNFPRGIAVIFLILIFLGLCIGVLILLVVEITNGTAYLASVVPQHFQSLVTYIQDFITSTILPIYQRILTIISSLEPSQQEAVIGNLQQIGEKMAQQGAAIIQSLLQSIPMIIKELPNYFTVLIFSFLGTFFISKDWDKISYRITSIIPSKVVTSFATVLKGLKQALAGFMKAQAILTSITAGTVLCGLLILRVDHAVTIAVITGAIDLMPYVGSGMIFIPWIIYMFLIGNYSLTVGLAILYMLVIIQRQMLEPKLLSTNIGLDPLATLISLFIGFQLFGFLGLIIGPVALVILNTLYQAGVFYEIWRFINEPKNTM